MKKEWSTSNIINLFRLTDSSKSPIIYAEEKGEIPTAKRISRGKIKVRQWNSNQLPKIGEKFGFLKKNKKQHIICTYTPKGGVIKTSFAFNFARMLAINGIKVIIIGLDFQQSITRYAIPRNIVESIEDIQDSKSIIGLYHFLYEKAPLSQVICTTDLPTLDVIPETPDLNFMTKKMRLENRREYIFKERLISKLEDYDVIVFDCNPGWSDLIENALVASSSVIMPIACETECFEALRVNLGEIADFQKAMYLNWQNYFMVPTLLENNAISQNIYAAYLNAYNRSVIPVPIRRSVIGQEARLENISVIEYNPNSNLAQDYFEAIENIWSNLNHSL